jgi:two-component system, OmpR family, KDP operon response regulator KdpE
VGCYSIIVISARSRNADKVDELDTGADDYLTKPFSLEELTARLRVAACHFTQSWVGKAEPIVQTGELRVDLAGRMVWVGGEEIHLTPGEFKLLVVLVRHSGKIVTKQLLKEVWGHGSDEQGHYLRNYSYHLGHKLAADPVRPADLRTEPGIGYRLGYKEYPCRSLGPWSTQCLVLEMDQRRKKVFEKLNKR